MGLNQKAIEMMQEQKAPQPGHSTASSLSVGQGLVPLPLIHPPEDQMVSLILSKSLGYQCKNVCPQGKSSLDSGVGGWWLW